jgi:hypothetical protein
MSISNWNRQTVIDFSSGISLPRVGPVQFEGACVAFPAQIIHVDTELPLVFIPLEIILCL